MNTTDINFSPLGQLSPATSLTIALTLLVLYLFALLIGAALARSSDRRLRQPRAQGDENERLKAYIEADAELTARIVEGWNTADSHRPRETTRPWFDPLVAPEPIELSPGARRYIDMRMLDVERRIQKRQRAAVHAYADIDWDAEVARAYAEENGHPYVEEHTYRNPNWLTVIGTPITPEVVADTLRRARATSVSFHG